MKSAQTYFILSGLFLTAFLVVQFTTIYGNPGWFKVFALILAIAFFLGGVNSSRDAKNKSDET